MRAAHFVVLFGLFLAAAAPLQAQATLTGIVRDSAGQSLPRVQIVIEGTTLQASSDTNGRFTISGIPAGRWGALFRSVGYRPVRLLFTAARGNTVRAEPVLVRAAAELEPLVVEAASTLPRGSDAAGFEERRRLGLGKFIESAELRRAEHLRPADVLRRAAAGIELVPVADSFGKHFWARSTRKVVGDPCWSQVFLDGMAVYRPNTGRDPFDFLNEISVSELQAIEVYRSDAETPIEFSGFGADCGTIVLWTRRNWDALAASAAPDPARGDRRLGLFVGMSFATLSGPGAAQFGDRSSVTSGLGGISLETPVGPRLVVGPELFLTSKGVKGTSANNASTSTVSMDFGELAVPFKLRIPIGSSTIQPVLQAGPFVAFRFRCGAHVVTAADTVPADINCVALDLSRGLDWGVQAGTGLNAGPFFFGVRYDFGLENLNGGTNGGAIRTRSLAVVSGVAFRVWKK